MNVSLKSNLFYILIAVTIVSGSGNIVLPAKMVTAQEQLVKRTSNTIKVFEIKRSLLIKLFAH